jgi:hypothetical protein
VRVLVEYGSPETQHDSRDEKQKQGVGTKVEEHEATRMDVNSTKKPRRKFVLLESAGNKPYEPFKRNHGSKSTRRRADT